MVRSLLLLVLASILFNACYSKKKSVEASLPYSEKINWPKAYIPSKARFFAHNEIKVNASPQVVWDILTQAEAWPDWYKGASDVKVRNSDNGVLKDNSMMSGFAKLKSRQKSTRKITNRNILKVYESPFRNP